MGSGCARLSVGLAGLLVNLPPLIPYAPGGDEAHHVCITLPLLTTAVHDSVHSYNSYRRL